jgi:hypothetical protein
MKFDLLFDVRARVSIANLCRDKKFENFGELWTCAESDIIKNTLKVLKIMSNSAEYAKRKAQGLEVNVNADYNAIPLTEADLYDMMSYELDELQEEIVEVIKRDSVQSVKANEGKKKAK